jgi:hypothetical protein
VKRNLFLAAVALATASSLPAGVIGEFSFAGLGPAYVNSDEIDFAYSIFLQDGPVGEDVGRFLVTEVEGDFAAIPTDINGEIRGTIRDLNNPPVVPGLFQAMPNLLPNFIIFDNSPISLDLVQLNLGTGSAADCGSTALNASCTPLGSPFTLRNDLTGVSVIMSVNALAYAGPNDMSPTPYRGLFTTQITSLPTLPLGSVPRIPDVLGAAATQGVLSSISAEFAPVPEPSTVLLGMFGIGLLAVGRFARRRQ